MVVRSIVALVVLVSGPLASAATLTVLSTGAVEPGIRAAAEEFKKATGHEIRIAIQTAPEVKQRLEAREVWDLAIATPAAEEAGRVRTDRVAPGPRGLGLRGHEPARPDAGPDVAAAFLEYLKSPAPVALFRARGIDR